MSALLGFGDEARPVGEGGMTADLFVKNGRHHFQLVAWGESGLGCEILSTADDGGAGYATEADARAAAPIAAEAFLRKFEGFAGVDYQIVPFSDPIGDTLVVQVSQCGACGALLYADEPRHVCELEP